MKKYHVYGMGNALVDTEVDSTDDFLKSHQIEKGLMTLIEQDRYAYLADQLKGKTHHRTCGGSAANTVIGVSQLGGRSFYSCRVANDESGEFYLKDMSLNGVDYNGQVFKDKLPTGQCMVFITPDAERTMNTYLGMTSQYGSDCIDFDALKNSNYLYVEGYLVTSPTAMTAALECIRFARNNGVKTSITFSDPGIVQYFKQNFITLFDNQKMDVVFANEHEVKHFTGLEDIDDALDELKKFTHTFAITLGANGAVVYDGKQVNYIETKKVHPVDTNGAGDLFAGSFLYGINHDLSYKDSAVLATQCASTLVTQYGARLKKGVTEKILKDLNFDLNPMA